jgi:hypothetical protein
MSIIIMLYPETWDIWDRCKGVCVEVPCLPAAEMHVRSQALSYGDDADADADADADEEQPTRGA